MDSSHVANGATYHNGVIRFHMPTPKPRECPSCDEMVIHLEHHLCMGRMFVSRPINPKEHRDWQPVWMSEDKDRYAHTKAPKPPKRYYSRIDWRVVGGFGVGVAWGCLLTLITFGII